MTDEELRERAEKAEAGLEQAVNVDRIKTAELTRLREVINEGDLKMMTLLAQRDALLAALRDFPGLRFDGHDAERMAVWLDQRRTAISNAEGSLT